MKAGAVQAARPTAPGGVRTWNRSLAGWLIGYASSQLGDQMFFLTLTWAAIQVGTPAEVGLVVATASVPRIVLLLFGGALADRVGPKLMIMVADGGRTAVMAAAALVVSMTAPGVGVLVAVALLIGALDGLLQPAIGALPARIADSEAMPRVAALRTTVGRLVLFVGGPLTGVVIGGLGVGASFWLSAALFAGSVAALALVTVPPLPERGTVPGDPDEPLDPSAATGVLADVANGLRTVIRRPVLPWLLLGLGFVNVGFSGPVTAGLPLLSAARGWGAEGAGLLLGAFGLGAAAVGLCLVVVPRIPHAGRVVVVGAAVMAVALGLVAFAGSFWVSLTAAVALGAGSGLYGTAVQALLLTTTPKADLGRVMSVLSLMMEGVVPVSLVLAGALAAVSLPASFLVGAVLIATAAAVCAARPEVRSARLSGS